MKSKYKKNDIVLVKSVAGDEIPHIHVKLLERVVVKPQKGNNMDWPGYSGWEAEALYESELAILRKKWSIPLKVGSSTWVYDDNIIKKEKDELQSETQEEPAAP